MALMNEIEHEMHSLYSIFDEHLWYIGYVEALVLLLSLIGLHLAADQHLLMSLDAFCRRFNVSHHISQPAIFALGSVAPIVILSLITFASDMLQITKDAHILGVCAIIGYGMSISCYIPAFSVFSLIGRVIELPKTTTMRDQFTIHLLLCIFVVILLDNNDSIRTDTDSDSHSVDVNGNGNGFVVWWKAFVLLLVYVCYLLCIAWQPVYNHCMRGLSLTHNHSANNSRLLHALSNSSDSYHYNNNNNNNNNRIESLQQTQQEPYYNYNYNHARRHRSQHQNTVFIQSFLNPSSMNNRSPKPNNTNTINNDHENNYNNRYGTDTIQPQHNGTAEMNGIDILSMHSFASSLTSLGHPMLYSNSNNNNNNNECYYASDKLFYDTQTQNDSFPELNEDDEYEEEELEEQQQQQQRSTEVGVALHNSNHNHNHNHNGNNSFTVNTTNINIITNRYSLNHDACIANANANASDSDSDISDDPQLQQSSSHSSTHSTTTNTNDNTEEGVGTNKNTPNKKMQPLLKPKPNAANSGKCGGKDTQQCTPPCTVSRNSQKHNHNHQQNIQKIVLHTPENQSSMLHIFPNLQFESLDQMRSTRSQSGVSSISAPIQPQPQHRHSSNHNNNNNSFSYHTSHPRMSHNNSVVTTDVHTHTPTHTRSVDECSCGGACDRLRMCARNACSFLLCKCGLRGLQCIHVLIVKYVSFPVRMLLQITIPSCDFQSEWEFMYPCTFILSLSWILIFSVLIVFVTYHWYVYYGYSLALLGLLLVSVPLSIPSILECIPLALQGYSTQVICHSYHIQLANLAVGIVIPLFVSALLSPVFQSTNSIRTGFLLYLSVGIVQSCVLFVPLMCFKSKNVELSRHKGWVFILTYMVCVIIGTYQQLPAINT